MTSAICFITSIYFCSTCPDSLKCDGMIHCAWYSPHDEANCLQQCPFWCDIPCDCNKPGNMTCEGFGEVCYDESCKFYVLFYFSETSQLL